MNDTISRQQALDWFRNRSKTVTMPGAKRMYLLAVEALSEDGDTISRQAAIEKILGQPPEPHYPSWYAEQIKELPSAEPQIIRCKDCKHWIPYDWMFSEVWQSKNIADYPEDEIGCDCCDMAMKANDFCSRAEMKEVTT